MVLTKEEKVKRYEFIVEESKRRNWTLISDNYQRRIRYICNNHPEKGEREINVYKFMEGKGCKNCSMKRAGKEYFSKSIDEIRAYFDSKGCVLISNYYENQNTPLIYRCKIHWDLGDISTTYRSYYGNHHPCRQCFLEANTTTLEQAKKDFKKVGLILWADHYDGSMTMEGLPCECPKHEGIIQLKPLYEVHRGRGCRYCSYEKMGEKHRGENHYNWKGGTYKSEDEALRKTYDFKMWRNTVYKRDNYTCQKCHVRGGYLHAHHKDGWNWCIDKRFDVDNGVTLCEDCHNEFHSMFGRGYNTKEQFTLFTG